MSDDQREVGASYQAALLRFGRGAVELDEGQQILVDPEQEIRLANDLLWQLLIRYPRYGHEVRDIDARKIVDQAGARLARASRQLQRDAGR
jgi:hypothetical protein